MSESNDVNKKSDVTNRNQIPFYGIPSLSLSNPVFLLPPDGIQGSQIPLYNDPQHQIQMLQQPATSRSTSLIAPTSSTKQIVFQPQIVASTEPPNIKRRKTKPPSTPKPSSQSDIIHNTSKAAMSNQLGHFRLTPPNNSNISFVMDKDCSRSRKRKSSISKKDLKEASCQTSGWKFMSEIGTIESVKNKKKNVDKQASKSSIVNSLRVIFRKFKERVELMNYDNQANHTTMMEDISTKLRDWLCNQYIADGTFCLVCEQQFTSEELTKAHIISCPTVQRIFEEIFVVITQTLPVTNALEPESEAKSTLHPNLIQDIFSKSYVHGNDAKDLKKMCMLCGDKTKSKDVADTDIYLDKRHFFDACIVFKSFLMFLDNPHMASMCQKIGTSWTLIYYYTFLNYFALNFTHKISDLRFLKEDKAHLIIRNFRNIAENVCLRASSCPLCYAVIESKNVLYHHLVFTLCPVLSSFFTNMKNHMALVWNNPVLDPYLRKISCCFQYYLGYQTDLLPIVIKQSILDDKLCAQLLENAMYFRTLDSNFSLQFYKTPKDVGVAQKIEEMQQVWAENVINNKSDTECPFCFTIFNNDKNLLKHIMYISCKSMRPVCNQIYNLLEYSEWDVLQPMSLVTQHTAYILKNAILGGDYEINLTKEQLAEYIEIVTDKFLTLNLSDGQKQMIFESSDETVSNMDKNPTDPVFADFYLWARKFIKKKTASVCPLCGSDEQNYATLLDHIAMGVCPYLKQFLVIMAEIYKYNHVFQPCPLPEEIHVCQNRNICCDIVHHIRKVLFIFKGACKAATSFFNQEEFEAFLISSPYYVKHYNLISMLIEPNSTKCSYCFLDIKSRDRLLLHLLYFQCPTFLFVVDLVENEWKKCSKGNAPVDKMLEIIKIYSSMFELDANMVISSGYMKKFFLDTSNETMVNNIRSLKNWSKDMYSYDEQSTLNICRACNVAAVNIQRHLWLEEPTENFCPEIRSYLDFHRKMVCKKDNRGEIRASFTVTDLFDLKRFLQTQYSHFYDNSGSEIAKQSVLSPSLLAMIKGSITSTLKVYPRYDGTMESFKLMFGTLPSFLNTQLSIANKLAISKICFLCNIMLESDKEIKYHIATFECKVLQSILQDVKSSDQIDSDILKNEITNAYKRTVAFCREEYPNLNEGNLLLLMESVDSRCHSKLYNFIMSKFPRTNPYQCLFCLTECSTLGEIYTHYKKIQCAGLRECFGYIPNKAPVNIKHPFLRIIYNIFVDCYNTFGTRSYTKIKSQLVSVNNHADMYEFWCSNYCDSLVPACQFCGQGLNSVSAIKSHPKLCPKLREINLDVFGSDRSKDSIFMKEQGLGSCKTAGALPKEVIHESEGIPFMQRFKCSQYLGWIPLCLDCATNKVDEKESARDEEDDDNGTCRFLWFRRLIKRDSRLSVFDFESSQTVSNVTSWVPARQNIPELDVESAKYILRHLLPHFNKLMSFEMWELENAANLRLKHQVKNVREICDSCFTTLFNIHLFCPRCGFVICMDCYTDRLSGVVTSGLGDCSDGSVHCITALDKCVTIPPRASKQLCSAVKAIKDMHCIAVTDIPFYECPSDDLPYEMICHGQVLALRNSEHPRNALLYQKFHQKGNATVVYNVLDKIERELWTPQTFSKYYGQEKELVVNTTTLDIHRILLKDFWDGFENINERPRNENGDPMVLKLKDWPTTWDFRDKLPRWYEDFMKVIPLKQYTMRKGLYNIAHYLPPIYCTPDLGPKMYIAYSNANNPSEGSTVLHIDISDAANIIMYVGQSQDVVIKYTDDEDPAMNKQESSYLKRKVYNVRELCEDTDEKQIERIMREGCKIGALWHIYHPNDIDKIRHFINKMLNERGQSLPPDHDPIHDQAMYLDGGMRKRLFQEYGVKGWAITQCEGDAVLIPAGAPHQVRNLQSCIKIAEDFVSPERVGFCLMHTEEIRHLSKFHHNHEDKLQIKNLLYHAVKECVSVLQNNMPTKDPCSCKPPDTCAVAAQASLPEIDPRDDIIASLQKELEHASRDRVNEKHEAQQKLEIQEVALNRMKKRLELEREKCTNYSSKLEAVENSQQMMKMKAQKQKHTSLPAGKDSKAVSKRSALQSTGKLPQSAAYSDARKHQSSSSSRDQTRRSGSADDSRKIRYPQSLEYRPQVTANIRDPRLKTRMIDSREEAVNIPGPNILKRPNNDPVQIPKSAFQGVRNAVQDLRKKQPPPQKIRRTPGTPEPMDTNQDSCSPKPGGSNMYHERNKTPSFDTHGVNQRSSNQQQYLTSQGNRYDPGASNSETDSNEEPAHVNTELSYPQFSNHYATLQQSSKTLPMRGEAVAFNSPSASPGFHPKSLNLQISSPKQPAIFKNQNSSQNSDVDSSARDKTYQKVKEGLAAANKPRQVPAFKPTSPRQVPAFKPTSPRQVPAFKPTSTLSEIFPIQTYTTSNVRHPTSTVYKRQTNQPIKTELRTPPNEKSNHPTFAPHLASYLPELLTRSNPGYDSSGGSWYGNSEPRKSTQSPVTPTLSPAIASQSTASPVTPSPPPTCKSLVKPPPIISHDSQSPLSPAPTSVTSTSAPICSASFAPRSNKVVTPKLELTRTAMPSSCGVIPRVEVLRSDSAPYVKGDLVKPTPQAAVCKYIPMLTRRPASQMPSARPLKFNNQPAIDDYDIDTDKLTADVLKSGVGMPEHTLEPPHKLNISRELKNSRSSESFESISSTPSDQSTAVKPVGDANCSPAQTDSFVDIPKPIPVKSTDLANVPKPGQDNTDIGAPVGIAFTDVSKSKIVDISVPVSIGECPDPIKSVPMESLPAVANFTRDQTFMMADIPKPSPDQTLGQVDDPQPSTESANLVCVPKFTRKGKTPDSVNIQATAVVTSVPKPTTRVQTFHLADILKTDHVNSVSVPVSTPAPLSTSSDVPGPSIVGSLEPCGVGKPAQTPGLYEAPKLTHARTATSILAVHTTSSDVLKPVPVKTESTLDNTAGLATVPTVSLTPTVRVAQDHTEKTIAAPKQSTGFKGTTNISSPDEIKKTVLVYAKRVSHGTEKASTSENRQGNSEEPKASVTQSDESKKADPVTPVDQKTAKSQLSSETNEPVIFDDKLMSRLRKKKASSSSLPHAPPVSTSHTVINDTIISKLSQAMVTNPLLARRKPIPASTLPKVVKKPHLAETVDAILKSDKQLDPLKQDILSSPIEQKLPFFDKIKESLSSAVRDRASSGSSSCSAKSGKLNMIALSPVSPALSPAPTSTDTAEPGELPDPHHASEHAPPPHSSKHTVTSKALTAYNDTISQESDDHDYESNQASRREKERESAREIESLERQLFVQRDKADTETTSSNDRKSPKKKKKRKSSKRSDDESHKKSQKSHKTGNQVDVSSTRERRRSDRKRSKTKSYSPEYTSRRTVKTSSESKRSSIDSSAYCAYDDRDDRDSYDDRTAYNDDRNQYSDRDSCSQNRSQTSCERNSSSRSYRVRSKTPEPYHRKSRSRSQERIIMTMNPSHHTSGETLSVRRSRSESGERIVFNRKNKYEQDRESPIVRRSSGHRLSDETYDNSQRKSKRRR